MASSLRVHKLIAILSITAILGGGYFWYKAFAKGGGETQYVLARVQRGTIVVSVSGSGQVSASNQVDVKPKVPGEITAAAIKNGDAVKAGTLIAELDARDARKAVRDAEVALESANLALRKLNQPTDAADIQAAASALAKARLDLEKLTADQRVAEDDLREKRDTAASDIGKKETDRTVAIRNAFADLPAIITGLQDILFGKTINGADENHVAYAFLVKDYAANVSTYEDNTVASYRTARESYDRALGDYQKEVSAGSQSSDAFAQEAETTAIRIAASVDAANGFLDLVQDVIIRERLKSPAVMATHESSLDTHTSKAGAGVTSIRSGNRSVADARQALADTEKNLATQKEKAPRDRAGQEQTVRDKEVLLEKLNRGTDALDIESAKITIKQKENALADAREKLSDYVVRAPFEGVVAATDMRIGDTVSSATVLATIITHQKLAEISLNEVDAAKVKAGQKTTLTFDAIPDLTLSGAIAELDTVGTVSQGVVTYKAKVSFDASDGRIKPGMSVAGAIIIEAKLDVLTVPNAAVKSQGQTHYVELVTNNDTAAEVPRTGNGATATGASSAGAGAVTLKTAPLRQQVETGVSND